MTFSVSNPASSIPPKRTVLPSLAFVLALLALIYLAIGLTVRGDPYRASDLPDWSGLLLPLRLFILAILAAGAACALMWAERALGDLRTRRLVRGVVALGAGIAVIILADGLPS